MARREEFSVSRLIVEGEPRAADRVMMYDGQLKPLLLLGSSVPANGTAGYATGAIFIKTSIPVKLYVNIGTPVSCEFAEVSFA